MTYRIYPNSIEKVGLQFHVFMHKLLLAKDIFPSPKLISIFSRKGSFVFVVFCILFVSLHSFQYSAATDVDTRTNCINCLAPTMRGLGFYEIDDGLTIDGKVFKITSKSNPVTTTTVETGTNLQIKLKMYEDYGASNVQNVELYMNLPGTASSVEDSDTYITYEKNKDVIVIDPNGLFSNVKLTTLPNGNYLVLTYDITFAKPMKQSDLIIKAWDFERNPEVNKVLDALKVLAPTPMKGNMTEAMKGNMTEAMKGNMTEAMKGNMTEANKMKEKEIPTPLAQLKSGLEPEKIECKKGLEKILKPGSKLPACVKPGTLKILLNRGWTLN